MPSLQTKTRLILVMHYREAVKPTATAPLAAHILKNSEKHLHGVADAPLNLESLHRLPRRLLMLFPSNDARVLAREDFQDDPRPISLVVPDGNWRQASRIPKRVPGLSTIEKVVLPKGQVSAWGVRRETRVDGLATFEAIARAFGILESAEVQKSMEDFFKRVVALTLALKTGRPIDPA